MARDYTNYLTWIGQEFLPLTLATPEETLKQMYENAIRYFNTNSAYKVSSMVKFGGSDRVQIDPQFKTVVDVLPANSPDFIWASHPLWTLVGVTVLDNITTDLIMLSEAYRNYRVYVGTDFQWIFEKSDDPIIGGHLFCVHVPSGSEYLYVVGTKRIMEDEDVVIEQVKDWLYRYSKTLVKQVEGNTLRKSGIINIANDGQQLVDEGKEEAKDLRDELSRNSRWVVLARRC